MHKSLWRTYLQNRHALSSWQTQAARAVVAGYVVEEVASYGAPTCDVNMHVQCKLGNALPPVCLVPVLFELFQWH